MEMEMLGERSHMSLRARFCVIIFYNVFVTLFLPLDLNVLVMRKSHDTKVTLSQHVRVCVSERHDRPPSLNASVDSSRRTSVQQ